MIRFVARSVSCRLFVAACAFATTASLPSVPKVAEVRLSASSTFWHRGIIVVSLTNPAIGSAIVDTGGDTESRKQHPRNFETYYHGLPIDFSLGPDYLARRRVLLGNGGAAALRVPLLLSTQDHSTFAFVRCAAGGAHYRLLLDTAALAWAANDSARAQPIGVTLMRADAFSALRKAKQSRAGPPWQIMGESGHFVNEPSIIIASLTCGPVTTRNTIVVERSDNTTYAFLARTYGLAVDGDIGLAGLTGSGWSIDFPSHALIVNR